MVKANQRPYLRNRHETGYMSKADLLEMRPTSVTPIHDYPMGRHSLSSATARYNGSGRHAGAGSAPCRGGTKKNARCKCPRRHCIRLLTPILDLPGNQCLAVDRGLDVESGENERTKVHNMVAADGTIVDHDVCPCVRLAQRNGGKHAHPKPIALPHSTREGSKREMISGDGASTFLTSNRFLSFASSFVFFPDPVAGGSTSISSAMVVRGCVTT